MCSTWGNGSDERGGESSNLESGFQCGCSGSLPHCTQAGNSIDGDMCEARTSSLLFSDLTSLSLGGSALSVPPPWFTYNHSYQSHRSCSPSRLFCRVGTWMEGMLTYVQGRLVCSVLLQRVRLMGKGGCLGLVSVWVGLG